MSNRAERRRAAREAQKVDKAQSKAEIVRQTMRANPYLDSGSIGFKANVDIRQKMRNRIDRNGITEKDMDDQYRLGFTEGRETAQKADMLTYFAAICIALEKLHGFDSAQCHEVLTEVYNFIAYEIDSEESIQAVFDRIGLQIDIRHMNPLDDPVEEVR